MQHVRDMGFPVDGKMIYYYNYRRNIHIYSGKDPLPPGTVIPGQELIHSDDKIQVGIGLREPYSDGPQTITIVQKAPEAETTRETRETREIEEEVDFSQPSSDGPPCVKPTTRAHKTRRILTEEEEADLMHALTERLSSGKTTSKPNKPERVKQEEGEEIGSKKSLSEGQSSVKPVPKVNKAENSKMNKAESTKTNKKDGLKVGGEKVSNNPINDMKKMEKMMSKKNLITIGEIVDTVQIWKDEILNPGAGGMKMSSTDVALKMGVSEKTLYAYLGLIRNANLHNFNFYKHHDKPMSFLETFVKKAKEKKITVKAGLNPHLEESLFGGEDLTSDSNSLMPLTWDSFKIAKKKK